MKVKMQGILNYANTLALYEKLQAASNPELEGVISFDSAGEQVVVDCKTNKYFLTVENGVVFSRNKSKPISNLVFLPIIGWIVLIVLSIPDSKTMKAVRGILCKK